MTRAIKKRLRGRGLQYRVGNLGELMEENFNQARRAGALRYRPEHLNLLRGVRENPGVVDIAFEVLTERLAEKGVDLPLTYDERLRYDFDYRRILGVTVLLALAMTGLITAAVLFAPGVAAMTTLIVAVSVAGAALFIRALYKLVIPVDPAV